MLLANASLDALEEQLYQGLNTLADDPDRLRSSTFFPHLRVLYESAV